MGVGRSLWARSQARGIRRQWVWNGRLSGAESLQACRLAAHLDADLVQLLHRHQARGPRTDDAPHALRHRLILGLGVNSCGHVWTSAPAREGRDREDGCAQRNSSARAKLLLVGGEMLQEDEIPAPLRLFNATNRLYRPRLPAAPEFGARTMWLGSGPSPPDQDPVLIIRATSAAAV